MDPVEVLPERVRKAPVDDKGRVVVGSDLAGEEVRVAVVDVVGAEDEQDEDDEEAPDESAWLCGSCQQTILAVEEPGECPSCGADNVDRLDVVRTGGSA